MKKKFLISFVVISLFSANLFSQKNLEFSLTNNTGMDLRYIHISESNKYLWGKNIIPADKFENGKTFHFSIPVYGETICSHDIKVTAMAGDYIYLRGIDLCEISKLTISLDENGGFIYKPEY